MKQFVLIMASLYGLLSIILGAFGAHKLKDILPENKLQSFEVGVRYQMYAALFLLIIGLMLNFETTWEKSAARLMILGAFLFSGSIYWLSFSENYNVPTSFLGPLTPVGGLLMILSWGALLIYFIQNK